MLFPTHILMISLYPFYRRFRAKVHLLFFVGNAADRPSLRSLSQVQYSHPTGDSVLCYLQMLCQFGILEEHEVVL